MFLCILEMVNAVLTRRRPAGSSARARREPESLEGIRREDCRTRRPDAARKLGACPRRARRGRLLDRGSGWRAETEPAQREARLLAGANAYAISEGARRRLSLPVRMPDRRSLAKRPPAGPRAQPPTATAARGAHRRNRRGPEREDRLEARRPSVFGCTSRFARRAQDPATGSPLKGRYYGILD